MKRSRKSPPRTPGRVETKNVNTGKAGPRIDAAKYEATKKALLKAIPRSARGIAFADLNDAVREHLPAGELPGGGAIPWYVATVKLDLEARGIVERIPGVMPQRLRRT
jgi:hypothetical protein